jgi:hypothetical protein
LIIDQKWITIRNVREGVSEKENLVGKGNTNFSGGRRFQLPKDDGRFFESLRQLVSYPEGFFRGRVPENAPEREV